MQRHQDVVLGREVVVERRLGDAELLGDLPQAGAVETLLGEEVQGHVEDPLSGVDRAGPVAAGSVAAGLIIPGRGARARESCVCLCHGPILAPSRALT